MECKIIDGTQHAAAVRAKVKQNIGNPFSMLSSNVLRPGEDVMCCIPDRTGSAPHLAIVLVGEDPASQVYIKHKKKTCEELGFSFTLRTLPETATQQEVLDVVEALNNNAAINGILVQQPLPPHINTLTIVKSIAPKKDVDCLHPQNLGLVAKGAAQLLPCTPAGVVELLKRENIEIAGKNAVVVGRSDVVGKPLALMLLGENATVTICHSHTQNLEAICRSADILVVAIGKAKFIHGGYVKPGAVVIDVGIHREGKKLCGDVDFDSVVTQAAYVTPVPGGVGPMTVAMLMQNCMRAWKAQR